MKGSKMSGAKRSVNGTARRTPPAQPRAQRPTGGPGAVRKQVPAGQRRTVPTGAKGTGRR